MSAGNHLHDVRAAIDAQIDGKTLVDLYERNAVHYGERTAQHWRDEGGVWHRRSWGEYRRRCQEAALGLAGLGVAPGDFVAITAGNRPEHLIADGGALHAAATPVSLYRTLAPEQVAYVASNCGAKVAIVDNRDDLKCWEEAKADIPSLETVVMIADAEDFAHHEWVVSWTDVLAAGRAQLADDPDSAGRLSSQLQPGDPATLIYTSGTTGPPKGVVITHRNVLWEMASIDRLFPWPSFPRSICYLPLAHVAERMFSHYMAVDKVGEVWFCPDMTQALEYVQAARPQAFLAVPRVWEKMKAGLRAKVDAEPDTRKRALATKALAVAQETARREVAGETVSLPLRLQHQLFDKLVYGKIRQQMALDDCEIALSGAAPLPLHVQEFFAGIGLPIDEVYGMTETTAVTNANVPGQRKIGTVGRAIPGCEVELADDGEVMVRGGNVAAGYYQRPEATAETFGADGWLRTGDLGAVDADGYLRIVGRKKEMIITAGGKNVAPAHIESLLKQHPLIDQACVVGDNQRYIAALIVLDPETAPGWAETNGLTYGDVASFAAQPRVIEEVQRAVDAANEHLSRAEQVKTFTILPAEWTADSDELTPTLKLKRGVIHDKHSAAIAELYAD